MKIMKKPVLEKLISMQWEKEYRTYLPIAERCSPTQAADILGLTTRALRNWKRRGLMPPKVRLGKSIYFRLVDIHLIAELLSSSKLTKA